MQATRSARATPTGSSSMLWRGALALGLTLLIAACGGGSDTVAPVVPAPPPAAGSVSGTVVVASNGAALAGVSVTAAGRSASTAADGSYTLTGVPPSDGVVISFALAGHAKSVLTLPVIADATARANARLTPVGATQSFDAAMAATIAVAGITSRRSSVSWASPSFGSPNTSNGQDQTPRAPTRRFRGLGAPAEFRCARIRRRAGNGRRVRGRGR